MSRYFEATDKVLNSHHLVVHLIDLAQSRGVHPDKLLKGTRLFYQDIARGLVSISPEQLARLVDNAVKTVDARDISFLLGRRFFPGELGGINNALLNARDLTDMIRMARVHQQQLFPTLFFVMHRSHGKRHFVFNHALGEPGSAALMFWAEFVATAFAAVFKWRHQRSPKAVFKFPFKAPGHFEQYQSHIGCPCLFEQPLMMISIEEDELTLPLPDHSRLLKRHALQALRQAPQQKMGFVQYLFALINRDLSLSLEQAAELLALSPATLKRKLKAHNTSFVQLKDNVRHQQAVFQIIEQGNSNEQVAANLKFSDLPNFRRAFKRWTGRTPNEIRARFC